MAPITSTRAETSRTASHDKSHDGPNYVGNDRWTVSDAKMYAPARFFAAYIAVATIENLFWEVTQLPLYTIWWSGTPHEILVTLIHCTGGDALIASFMLGIAAAVARLLRWPRLGLRMAIATISLGAAYTIFSEWLNVEIRRSWSYTATMPVLPWIGTGLAPLLQWLIVPSLAFAPAFALAFALAVARRAVRGIEIGCELTLVCNQRVSPWPGLTRPPTPSLRTLRLRQDVRGCPGQARARGFWRRNWELNSPQDRGPIFPGQPCIAREKAALHRGP